MSRMISKREWAIYTRGINRRPYRFVSLQRLQTFSMSLTSNITLLDSRRSIAEAQNVTQLTELAFLFIPLTFTATLLGMQIDQFENRVPLSTSIILGVSVTRFSYGVRLMIRSSWFRGIIEWSNESIGIYADHHQQSVQRGYVPTTLFLRQQR
jgi:Mg2+ and Co2+ transporter CorA